MRILYYSLSGLFISLATVCSKDPKYDTCDCAVQYFEESPDSPGTFFLEKEVREETMCAGEEGDTLYLSPSSKTYTYDCR